MRKYFGFLLSLSLMVALVGCAGSSGSSGNQSSGGSQTGSSGSDSSSSSSGSSGGGQSSATPKNVPGVTDTEILIGTWMPVTGPAAAWAVIGRSYEAYFAMVNEKGGIHGRKVRIILEDDSYSPAKTVPLVKKMVEQDKVFAFLGGLGTPSGSAVMSYIVENGVPHVAPSTGSSIWAEPVQKGYYAWQINYKTEARILVKYATETLKLQKYAIFYQNDDYGLEGLEEAKAQLAKRGIQVAAEVAYNPTDTDYSAHALKLKESGADAVLAWPSVRQFASLLKETHQIGYKPTWLASATVADTSVLALAPQEAQGVYFVGYLPDRDDPANANIPAIKEWRENFEKYAAKDLPMGNFSLYGWGQARLMHEALERAGRDLTRESFEKALQSFNNWEDLTTVTYTATDRRGIISGWIVQAKGENIVKVSDVIKAD